MEYLLISLFFSVVSLTYVNNFFLKYNIVDKVNDRSSHSTIATRSGGITFFLSVLLISLFQYIRGNEIFDYSILIPLLLLLLIGVYDDIYKIDFKLKFIFQIIAAKILIDNGYIIDNLHGFAGVFEISRIAAQLFTILIVLAIINAINFIDGLDGLAISIVLFFIIGFEFLSYDKSNFYFLSMMIVGSIIPMYYFNFRVKNKIFLGDSGSYFLGGIISVYVLHICSNEYLIKERFDLNKIIFVFSILFYPIIDLVRIFIIRLKNKKSPFIADKNHIHHLLLEYTNSHWLSTLIVVLVSFIVAIFLQAVF